MQEARKEIFGSHVLVQVLLHLSVVPGTEDCETLLTGGK